MNQSIGPKFGPESGVNQDQHHIELVPGKKYETAEGNEYIVNYIARESGNIEDMFAVYERVIPGQGQEDSPKQSWIKNTKSFKSVEDFDDENALAFEQPVESESEKEVSIGQRYQHFKTKDFYIIKAIARDPADPIKEFVIYEGQYNSPEFDEHPIWVREYEDFTGMKEFREDELDDNGNKKEPIKRFSQAKKTEAEILKEAEGMVKAYWTMIGQFGAVDNERQIIDEILAKLKSGKIGPNEAIDQARKTLEEKQGYHGMYR